MLKKVELFQESSFNEKAIKKYLVHDSPYFKVINFNFKAGQELPVHSHDIDGQLSIVVLEGQGEFLGKCHQHAATGGSVELGDHQAGDFVDG